MMAAQIQTVQRSVEFIVPAGLNRVETTKPGEHGIRRAAIQEGIERAIICFRLNGDNRSLVDAPSNFRVEIDPSQCK
jgi:uncharacterized membrane protein